MEEEKRVTKRNKKSNVMHSVRTKIVGAMILAMVILSVCLSVVLIRNLRIPLMNINQSYLYDLALAYGEKMQSEIEQKGYNTATHYNSLADSLSEVGLKGVETSYAYLFRRKGLCSIIRPRRKSDSR